MINNRNPLVGYLDGNSVHISGNLAISIYNKGYFGTPYNEGLLLNGFEALHLLELGRIKILREKQELNELDLIQYFTELEKDFMTRYFVYKDLRNRGYVVNVGKGSSYFFRLYTRTEKPKIGGARFYIRPLPEGGYINTNELEVLIERSKSSSKELVLGMVDANGDVSYLKVSELHMEKNT